MTTQPDQPRTRKGSAMAPGYAEIVELRSAVRSGSLAWAALSLLDTPSSSTGLVRRFEEEGARVETGRATELLEELEGLGVVRVNQAGASPVYVRTPLGDQ